MLKVNREQLEREMESLGNIFTLESSTLDARDKLDKIQVHAAVMSKGRDTLGSFVARNSCRQQIAHVLLLVLHVLQLVLPIFHEYCCMQQATRL